MVAVNEPRHVYIPLQPTLEERDGYNDTATILLPDRL